MRTVSVFLRWATNEEIKQDFRGRLKRLLRLRRDYLEELNEVGLRLLDRSIYGAYQDCLSIGDKRQANRILKQSRLTAANLTTQRKTTSLGLERKTQEIPKTKVA